MEPINIATLTPPMRVTRVIDKSGLEQLKAFFEKRKAAGGDIGTDIETTPVPDFYFRKVRTIQFGDQDEQFVIDLRAFCDSAEELADTQGHYGKYITSKLQEVLDVIEPVLCSADFTKVGVMLSFEYMNFYWQFGLRAFHFFDCAVTEKCIWAGGHSLKDYSYYSMEEMMERYFQVHIDKQYQESFTLDADLSDDQVMYAALDTRFPFAIKKVQELILRGVKYHPSLNGINPLVLGDDLQEIVKIENDCIGAFQDMHIHGEKLDRNKWLERVQKQKDDLQTLLTEMDELFIPLVGDKSKNITEQDIELSKAKWKIYNNPTDEEIQLTLNFRQAKKAQDLDLMGVLENRLKVLEDERKNIKEVLKKEASELGKTRTKIKNLAASCEGNALINYGSDAQLKKILNTMPVVQKALGKRKAMIDGQRTGPLEQVILDTLDDETLEKYERIPVMGLIRRYHGLSKQIGTYGDQWAMEWKTKPCKEEGWLHPGDSRLHSVFNQQDAETGRSSSEKPNGQNIEKDPEVRACFIADPPDETIRISDCCNAETIDKFNNGMGALICSSCRTMCTHHAEEYVIVTADMSGAELRIIAELANDPIWIGAFTRGEDVHSVGTEMMLPAEWAAATMPGCLYFKLKDNGEPQRLKCKCPGHEILRGNNKSTNFLLAYGGGPGKLAKEIGKSFSEAKLLMYKHSQAFPNIWAYLEQSGQEAQALKRSFDMYGRRRLFPTPDWDKAREYAKAEYEEELRHPLDVARKNQELFNSVHGIKPDKDQNWLLNHKLPSDEQIAREYQKMSWSIERQGKNHRIQGTNATIAKLAMGCGFDPNGIPYLWHTLPRYKAKLIKFVHDELVVQCPKRYAEEVKTLIGDAFKRAAAEKMKLVIMEFEAHIASYWKK